MVHRVGDPGELEEFFSDDRRVHVYALCDLEEPFWSASSWWREGDGVVGVIGLPDGAPTVYAVATRDPDASLRLLDHVIADLPARTLITGPTGTADVVERRRGAAWAGLHHRYVLVDRARCLAAGSLDVEPLGPEHADELRAFYDSVPGAAFFLASMLVDDTVGIRRDDRLVAAAGTHVCSRSKEVAAIGSVLTDPARRGEGLGARVTAGVVARAGEEVGTIGLNCAAENAVAQRLYERLGFESIHDYEEAEIA